jgi:hypothetical protein
MESNWLCRKLEVEWRKCSVTVIAGDTLTLAGGVLSGNTVNAALMM